MPIRLLLLVALVAAVSPVGALAQPTLTLTPLGTVKSGTFRSEDPRNAEINAYDPVGRRIYVVNPQFGRLDVIDAQNPAAPTQPVGSSLLLVEDCTAAFGAAACPLAAGLEPNSVVIHDGLLVTVTTSAVRTNNGHAIFYRLGASGPRLIAVVEVGAGPDMVTFTEDGEYALVANEGEPNQAYTIDPPGSVSIIEVARLGTPAAVRHVTFEAYDAPEHRAKLVAAGVRVFGPGASVSQDLEPEYIATRKNKAYVTLQENNALAILNITSATIEKIVPLGLKDYSQAGNALDPSDRDGIAIANWPVFGLYEPDSVDAFAVGGRTYLVMANEGDAREYTGFTETVRVAAGFPAAPQYTLDPLVFPNGDALKTDTTLGRLTVSRASGDLDGDGDFDQIHTLGGRSVSIRDQQGRLVWDSGDAFERLSARLDALGLNLFNTTNSANARDNRSDDKGVEPESVVVGEVNGRPYAFVGLERDSGIVVLDLSVPDAPQIVTYVNNRKFPTNATTGALLTCSATVDCGDLGPEGLTFVPAVQSPTGTALLIVSNEVSSTTTIWRVQ